jgi:hypothetical protein
LEMIWRTSLGIVCRCETSRRRPSRIPQAIRVIGPPIVRHLPTKTVHRIICKITRQEKIDPNRWHPAPSPAITCVAPLRTSLFTWGFI